jgi:hypothetical protein
MENAFYEGPLRLRVPVNMQLDADGAFSFDVPLPSAEGALGEVRLLCAHFCNIGMPLRSPPLRSPLLAARSGGPIPTSHVP